MCLCVCVGGGMCQHCMTYYPVKAGALAVPCVVLFRIPRCFILLLSRAVLCHANHVTVTMDVRAVLFMLTA